mgnify:CR=1 FL=1
MTREMAREMARNSGRVARKVGYRKAGCRRESVSRPVWVGARKNPVALSAGSRGETVCTTTYLDCSHQPMPSNAIIRVSASVPTKNTNGMTNIRVSFCCAALFCDAA